MFNTSKKIVLTAVCVGAAAIGSGCAPARPAEARQDSRRSTRPAETIVSGQRSFRADPVSDVLVINRKEVVHIGGDSGWNADPQDRVFAEGLKRTVDAREIAAENRRKSAVYTR